MEARIISIDAWRNGCGGWDWNDMRECGTIEDFEDFDAMTTRRKLAYLRNTGYLGAGSVGNVCIEEDDMHIQILWRSDRMPLIAIEIPDPV